MGIADCGFFLFRIPNSEFRIQNHSLLSLLPPVQISCIEAPKLLLRRTLTVALSGDSVYNQRSAHSGISRDQHR